NIYGSGAIGGVASFRTKDVEDILKSNERWGTIFNGIAANNQGELVGSAFSALRASPNVDVVGGGGMRDRSEFKDGHGNVVDNSDSNAFSGLGKITVRPAEGHEVKFTALGYHTDFYNGTGLPNKSATVYDSGVTNYVTTLGWKYHR